VLAFVSLSPPEISMKKRVNFLPAAGVIALLPFQFLQAQNVFDESVSEWTHNGNGYLVATDPVNDSNHVLDTSGRAGNAVSGTLVGLVEEEGDDFLELRFFLQDETSADLSLGMTAQTDLSAIHGGDSTFFGPLVRLVDTKIQILEGDGAGGGSYFDADQSLSKETWYTFRMAIDSVEDRWSATLLGGAYSSPTELTHSTSDSEFGFRTGGSNALRSFAIRANNNNGSPSALLDDISAEIHVTEEIPLGVQANGYKGIWFDLGQYSTYGSKYSGGLSTYTAKHRPLAVYAPEVDKTFFIYGGAPATGASDLRIMVSWYDHANHLVPKPTEVMNKNTGDPHDNGVIQIDRDGYLWVFVSARNTSRPSAVFRSDAPYSTASFTEVATTGLGNTNAYPQLYYIPGGESENGRFFFFCTRYTAGRELYFNTSIDGVNWAETRKLAGFGGHYQVSNHFGNLVGTAFNQHLGGNDNRTDLNYMQSDDFGATWTTVDGSPIAIPVMSKSSPARIIDYASQKLLVYVKDMVFDENGYPHIFYLTVNDASGNGHEPGPDGEPRLMRVTRWTGTEWETTSMPPSATASSTVVHNYNMGSFSVEGSTWTAIIPSGAGAAPGPGATATELAHYWGQGGEMETWQSEDYGKSWKRIRAVTRNSPRKHSYARNVLGGTDPFFTLWADGNPEATSEVHLYFGNRLGTQYWELPYNMEDETASPEPGKDSYLRWQESHLDPETLKTEGELEPTEDSDGDQASNHLEFLFGTNPIDVTDTPAHTLTVGQFEGTPALIYSYAFNGELGDDALRLVESTDLNLWVPATNLIETGRSTLLNGRVQRELTDSRPLESDGSLFLRLVGDSL
jgi:hypothetical protein